VINPRMGHLRPRRAKPHVPVRPLRSESDQSGAFPQTDAMCHKPTYAVQQLEAYSITSSARVSSAGGTSSPSACAVFKLMNSSIFVDCWTGRSDGFSPLRIRPV
jgi:hypothetical protein